MREFSSLCSLPACIRRRCGRWQWRRRRTFFWFLDSRRRIKKYLFLSGCHVGMSSPPNHYLLPPGLGLDPTSFSGTAWLVLTVACPSIPPTLLWYPSVARLLHQCDATLPHLQTPLLQCCQPALQAAAAPPPPPSCPTRQHDGAVDVVFGTPRRCPRLIRVPAASWYATTTRQPTIQVPSRRVLSLPLHLPLFCCLLALFWSLLCCPASCAKRNRPTYLHLLCAACVQVAGTTAARLTANNTPRA
ncbi:hypothetical protein IWZ01DRAFT_228072 [Phyllosticta capitalensis]